MALKKKYKRIGADIIKTIENISRIEVAMIQPVFLDELLRERLELLSQGGYDVYSVPYLCML